MPPNMKLWLKKDLYFSENGVDLPVYILLHHARKTVNNGGRKNDSSDCHSLTES